MPAALASLTIFSPSGLNIADDGTVGEYPSIQFSEDPVSGKILSRIVVRKLCACGLNSWKGF